MAPPDERWIFGSSECVKPASSAGVGEHGEPGVEYAISSLTCNLPRQVIDCMFLLSHSSSHKYHSSNAEIGNAISYITISFWLIPRIYKTFYVLGYV